MHIIYVKRLLWKLVGGPLSEMDRLKRFMASVENNIFSDFKWAKHATDEQLINKYKKTRIFRSRLKISYLLKSTFVKYELEQLQRNIVREAEVRLFDCKTQVAFARSDFDLTFYDLN